MNPLEAAVLVVLLVLPFHYLVSRQIRLLSDPEYLRGKGVVIVVEDVLDGHSEAIGEFMGHPIWATVTFMGMVYRFDHVTSRRKRDSIRARELFLEPGLVYLTD